MIRDNIKKILHFYHYYKTDLLIFLRTALSITKFDNYSNIPFLLWYPHIVEHGEIVRSGLELFLRAKTKRFFQVIKTILNIKDKDELINKWTIINKKFNVDNFFKFKRTSIEYLMNIDELDTE